MENIVLENVFDEWNRGCVPFLNKLFNSIDKGLNGNVYAKDDKLVINHVDGNVREIVLNDPIDSVDNDNTLTIYKNSDGYKKGESYKVNFLMNMSDFNVKFIAHKFEVGNIIVSRKYVGYASVFEIRDIREKNKFIRIEFQDNDDTLCNEDMFIMKLLGIDINGKIEDIYGIVCDTILNYRNYSRIVMDKIYYKNTSSFTKNILGEIILENGELKRLITERKIGDSSISFKYDVDSGSSFSYQGKSGMKLDDLYKLEGYTRKLISK